MSTTKRPNRVQRALRLLREALPWNRKHRPARAQRIDTAREALTPPPQPYPCIEAARRQSLHGPRYDKGMCQLAVREAYGVASIGDFDGDGLADAEDDWKASHSRHPGDTDPPRGFPVFWGGGSRDAGHVAISAGNGWIWSTDIKRTGYFDLVRLEAITTRWGLPYLGSTRDVNGHPIKHGKVTDQ